MCGSIRIFMLRQGHDAGAKASLRHWVSTALKHTFVKRAEDRS